MMMEEKNGPGLIVPLLASRWAWVLSTVLLNISSKDRISVDGNQGFRRSSS